MAATWTKLRSGEWGVKLDGIGIRKGAHVTVTKRDGSATTVIIDRVIWTGNGQSLCTVADDKPRQYGPPKHCWECGCQYQGKECPSCGEDADSGPPDDE
jgi:hypothetical protein